MSQRRLISSIAVVTALSVSACGSDDAPTADSAESLPSPTTAPTSGADTTVTSPSTARPVSPTTKPTTPPPPMSDPTEENTVPTDASPVDIAVADLAERLDVDPADIEVVSIEEVTWPDGSLGCPEPGMAYTQALVDGSRIVLSVDDTEYEYHSGRGGDPFYCPAERVTPPAAGGGYGDL